MPLLVVSVVSVCLLKKEAKNKKKNTHENKTNIEPTIINALPSKHAPQPYKPAPTFDAFTFSQVSVRICIFRYS